MWMAQGFVERIIHTGEGHIMEFQFITALFLSWVAASLMIGLLMVIASLGRDPRNEIEPYR
jgi:hypothetical protein